MCVRRHQSPGMSACLCSGFRPAWSTLTPQPQSFGNRSDRKVGETDMLQLDPSGPRSRTGCKAGVVLAALLSLFAFIQCWLPLKTAIQVGADEGFELAK